MAQFLVQVGGEAVEEHLVRFERDALVDPAQGAGQHLARGAGIEQAVDGQREHVVIAGFLQQDAEHAGGLLRAGTRRTRSWNGCCRLPARLLVHGDQRVAPQQPGFDLVGIVGEGAAVDAGGFLVPADHAQDAGREAVAQDPVGGAGGVFLQHGHGVAVVLAFQRDERQRLQVIVAVLRVHLDQFAQHRVATAEEFALHVDLDHAAIELDPVAAFLVRDVQQDVGRRHRVVDAGVDLQQHRQFPVGELALVEAFLELDRDVGQLAVLGADIEQAVLGLDDCHRFGRGFPELPPEPEHLLVLLLVFQQGDQFFQQLFTFGQVVGLADQADGVGLVAIAFIGLAEGDHQRGVAADFLFQGLQDIEGLVRFAMLAMQFRLEQDRLHVCQFAHLAGLGGGFHGDLLHRHVAGAGRQVHQAADGLGCGDGLAEEGLGFGVFAFHEQQPGVTVVIMELLRVAGDQVAVFPARQVGLAGLHRHQDHPFLEGGGLDQLLRPGGRVLALQQGQHVLGAVQFAAEHAHQDLELFRQHLPGGEPFVDQAGQLVRFTRRADDPVEDIAAVALQLGQLQGGGELFTGCGRFLQVHQDLAEVEQVAHQRLAFADGSEEFLDQFVVAVQAGDAGAIVAAFGLVEFRFGKDLPDGCACGVPLVRVVEQLRLPHQHGKAHAGIFGLFQGAVEGRQRSRVVALHLLHPCRFRQGPEIRVLPADQAPEGLGSQVQVAVGERGDHQQLAGRVVLLPGLQVITEGLQVAVASGEFAAMLLELLPAFGGRHGDETVDARFLRRRQGRGLFHLLADRGWRQPQGAEGRQQRQPGGGGAGDPGPDGFDWKISQVHDGKARITGSQDPPEAACRRTALRGSSRENPAGGRRRPRGPWRRAADCRSSR